MEAAFWGGVVAQRVRRTLSRKASPPRCSTGHAIEQRLLDRKLLTLMLPKAGRQLARQNRLQHQCQVPHQHSQEG